MALIQANFTSLCLKRTVPFNAILPISPIKTSVGAAQEQKYPLKTLYLLHGYTGSCMDWFTLAALWEISAMHNIAIILPDGENHFYIDDEQRADLYGEYIGRELVDFTRRIFPLSDQKDDTIIAGVSMGGYGALRNGMKYNDTFGHVIAVSPANIISKLILASDRPNNLGATRGVYESIFGDLPTATERDIDLFWLAGDMVSKGETFPSLYFACGRNDMLVYENRRFHTHLENLGVRHIYDEVPGTHNIQFYNSRLNEGLARLDLDRPANIPNPFWVD